jgi:type II secretory pathway pseudopilin PulG
MPDIYLHLDGQQKGPYQPDQIRQLMAEGKASADTPAWQEGMSDWSTVSAVLPAVPAAGGPPVFRAPVPPPASAPARQGMSGWVIAAIVTAVLFVLAIPCIAILAGIALGPITNGILKAKENMSMQQARQIEIAMFSYANDHNGAYPTGTTSTEVFQKLIDGQYVTDPAVFYIAMPGKTKPTSSHLTAENVCYDVTSGVTSDSSDDVPLVFATGYVMTYSPNAMTEPDSSAKSAFPGMAVAYKTNSARFFNARSDGTVPGVISVTFDPGSKSYQQLKP